jgi:NADH-quinone oxidoreductase subunit E
VLTGDERLREEEMAQVTAIELRLGPRPDEPGPPITRGPQSYPADVTTRLSADAAAIIGRYPSPRSALLPMLHLVQAEDGYLTPAGIAFCATQLDLSPAEVTAVATFYSMYRRTPTGDYLVGVCTNTLCAVMGGDAILEVLEEHLGVHAGQTTDDGKVTLEHVECNAACDYAPVVMVNWEFFDNQTPSSARELVDQLREGVPVSPTRGASLCTFRETALMLAGFPDQRPGANDGAPGEATLAGLRVAHELGMTAPAVGDAGAVADGPDDERIARESIRDQPAPAPEADVPPTNGKPA